MILFIDDERNYPSAGRLDVITARTSAEALEYIRKSIETGEHYSEIWFDHDLGGDDTSIPVLDFLSEMAFNENPYRANMVVHTANPVGRDTIQRGLERWGYPTEIIPATNWG